MAISTVGATTHGAVRAKVNELVAATNSLQVDNAVLIGQMAGTIDAVGVLQGQQVANDNRLDAAEAALTALDDRADATAEDVTSLQGRASALEVRGATARYARPGDEDFAWSSTLTGPAKSRPVGTAGIIVNSSGMGASLQIRGTDVDPVSGFVDVALRADFAIESGRTYRVDFTFARASDPSDPAGHGVELRLQTLSFNKSGLSNDRLGEVLSPTVADGVLVHSFLIGRSGAAGSLDYTCPFGTRYAVPFIRLYGNGHQTNLAVIGRIEDVTDFIVGGVDAAAEAAARIAADEALNTRLDFVQDNAVWTLIDDGGGSQIGSDDGGVTYLAARQGQALTAYENFAEFTAVFSVTNSVTNPQIGVNGIGLANLRNSTGGLIPIGDIVVGRPYGLKIYGTTFRIISGATASIDALSARIDDLDDRVDEISNIGSLQQLREALGNNLLSVNWVRCGDSNEWGATATGITDTTPRGQLLSDVRNTNFDPVACPTTFNLMLDYLGRTYGGGTLTTDASDPDPDGAWGRWRSLVHINPARDSRIRYLNRSTGAAMTKPSPSTQVAAYHGEYLQIPSADNAMLEFDFRGDEIQFMYARNTSTPGALVLSYQVDDDEVQTINLDGAVLYGQIATITTDFGPHRLRLWNSGTGSLIRVEDIGHNRQIQLRNQGIYGSNLDHWLKSADRLYPGIRPEDEFVTMIIGTNMGTGITTMAGFKQKLIQFSNDVIADGKKLILQTSCPEYGDPFPNWEKAQAHREVAKELGVDIIDVLAAYMVIPEAALMTGDNATGYIRTDNVHQTDKGHRLKFKTELRAIGLTAHAEL